MWRMVKNFFRFRMAQKMSKRTATKLGLGSLATVVGIVAGVRALRRGY